MKVKRIEIAAGILTLALTVVISGCSVSINLNNKKKESTENTETTETTKKKEETPAPESVEPSVSVSEEKTQQTDVQDQYTTYYVVNCNESITLRQQPDVNSGQITQIPLGSAVSYVESAQNGFYKVIYNGSTGYALASYLSTSKPVAYAAVPTQTSTENYETYYVVNCEKSITLRPQPDVNSGEICQIPLGSAVSYISAASNGFYYISYNGNKGYSLASYLSPSYGDNSVYFTCRVVNCNESITLRPQPDVNSGEICQIPLGETVSYVGAAENGFYEICYMGKNGYALANYLTFVN